MKTALVTGTSSGIGFEISQMLLDDNWIVYGIDKSVSKTQNSNYYHIKLDLNNLDINKLPNVKVSLVVNAAAIAVYESFNKTTMKEIEEIHNVNFKSIIQLCKYFIPKLVSHGSNHPNIINISSIHDTISSKDISIYASYKSALVRLTKNLAIEYGPHIRVNTISPGAINTEMLPKGANDDKLNSIIHRTPLKRLGIPQDIANLVKFIISNDASFITGHNFVIDGGASLILHTG